MIPIFPGGAAGVGLLILRASVAGSLLLIMAAAPNWAQLLTLTAAVALLLGAQTRVVAAITCIAPLIAISENTQLSLLHAANVLALLMLGPGSLSIDAALFGRRRLRLPDIDATSR